MIPRTHLFALLIAVFASTEQPAWAADSTTGFQVTGTCKSRDGSALDGATVEIVDPTSEAVLATTKCDARGAFKLAPAIETLLDRVHPFGPVWVRARASGHSPREIRVRAGAGGVELRLPAAFERKCRIIDREGRAIVGATATATAVTQHGVFRRAVDSGSDGWVVISDAASDVRALRVDCNGFFPEQATLRDMGDSTVRLRRMPTTRVCGRVLDSERRPLANAFVHGGFGNSTETDAQGVFELSILSRRVSLGSAGVRPAMDFLVVGKAGFRQSHASLGQEDPLEVVLQRAPPLRARLFSEAGTPVRHAYVVLKSLRDGSLSDWVPGWPLLIRSDAEGRVCFSSRIPAPAALEILRSGKPRHFAEVPREESDEEWEIRLPATAQATGRIVRAGVPVCGARVEAAGEFGIGMFARAPLSSLASLAHTYSDGSGRFALDVPDGTRAVYSFADEIRSSGAAIGSIPRGQTSDLGDLPLAAEHALSGVVIDDAGSHPAGGTVRCIASNGRSEPAETTVGSNGRFGFPRSATREYKLSFDATGYASTEVFAWPGDPIRIATSRLRGTASVGVTVEGVPKDAQATIRIFHVRYRQIERVVTTKPGSPDARAKDLPFGTYGITVTCPNHLKKDATVVVTPSSEEVHCKIRLDPGCRFQFTGTRNASVEIVPIGGHGARRRIVLGDNGLGEIGGLRSGRYLIVARRERYLTRVRTVELTKEHSQANVDLDLRESMQLTVRVEDSNGQPVVGVQVIQAGRHAVSVTSSGATDDEGRLTFDEVFEGPISLRVEDGRRSGSKSTVGEPGKVTEVTVRVEEQDSEIEIGPDPD